MIDNAPSRHFHYHTGNIVPMEMKICLLFATLSYNSKIKSSRNDDGKFTTNSGIGDEMTFPSRDNNWQLY